MNEREPFLPHHITQLIRSEYITNEQRKALQELWLILPEHHVHGRMGVPKCEHPECVEVRAMEKKQAVKRDWLGEQALRQWQKL